MNKIWLTEPNPLHNNYGIQATGDSDFIRKFDAIIVNDLISPFTNDPNYNEKQIWGAFHQGSDCDWSYWEFWVEQTPEFRAKVEAKVEELCERLDAILYESCVDA